MFKDLPLMPEQASTLAPQIDAIYFFQLAVAGFFATLIAAVLVFFAWRYRRRSPTERPKAVHGSNLLEIIWSVIPLIITMVMFTWGAAVYFHANRPPADALEIFVVAKQWMWKIQHPEGPREINELHVPIHRPVVLKMTSEDVIHSFFIPAFRTKNDVLPGRYTNVWFEATRPGRYHLFCAEYCGTNHAGMGGWVYAMKEDDYQKWLTESASGSEALKPGHGGSLEVQGARLFKKLRCDTCHHQGDQPLGPSLHGLAGSEVRLAGGRTVVADDNYLRESILNPYAKMVDGYDRIMPTFKTQVDEEGVMAMISYLKSLKETPAAE